MEVLLYLIVIVGWMWVRTRLTDKIIDRALGIERVTWNKATAPFYAPVDQMAARVLLSYNLVAWIHFGFVFLSILAVTTLFEQGSMVALFFLLLASFELTWFFGRWMSSPGGYIANIRLWRQHSVTLTMRSLWTVFNARYWKRRPKEWPKWLIDGMSLPGQSDAQLQFSAGIRYTWANDAGNEEEMRAAAADLQRSLGVGAYPRGDEVRDLTARQAAQAIYAFHLLSIGEVGKARETMQVTDVQGANNWGHVSLAWLDMIDGRTDSARKQLDMVYRNIADSPEMCDYVVEQTRRIMPEWEPPT